MKITTEHARFNEALSWVLSVSKEELLRREKLYQAERSTKPKRGPKPKHSLASDRASGNGDSD
jgi:hypothetical protein